MYHSERHPYCVSGVTLGGRAGKGGGQGLRLLQVIPNLNCLVDLIAMANGT